MDGTFERAQDITEANRFRCCSQVVAPAWPALGGNEPRPTKVLKHLFQKARGYGLALADVLDLGGPILGVEGQIEERLDAIQAFAREFHVR